MTPSFNLTKTAKTAALALPLIIGFAAYAAAHSEGACANNVVTSCNNAGGSTEAVNLCIINGLNACHTHSHGGGGGGSNSSASDDKAVESEPEGRRTRNVFSAKPAQRRTGRVRRLR